MFIPLEHQIRDLWDRKAITQASRRLELALTLGEMGPYQLQAAIAAIHCQAPNYASTDWPQIVMMYRLLFKCQANDVVLLNLSVAESYIYGMEYALQKIDLLAESLSAYQPFHATRADFLSKLDRFDESIKAYEHALALTSVVSERRYLQQQKKGVLERKPKQ